jgi:hypothetical protein
VPKTRKLLFPNEEISIPKYDMDQLKSSCYLLVDGDDLSAEQFVDIKFNKEYIVEPVVALSADQMVEFNKLVSSIMRNFANCLGYLSGCKIGEFRINLKDKHKLHFRHNYKKSEVERKMLRQFTDEWLQAGHVSLSTSQHSSPLFLVPKKDSSDRGVLDFRELNLNTEIIDWPIPRVDDLLFKVQKGIVYSILDAKSGFSQIMIHDLETRRLLAFSDGINPDKCVWFTDSVKLLGHVVSAKGVEPDPSKVDSIQNSKKPENVKQLQSFLGLCGYYRNFVQNYSDIAAPLQSFNRLRFKMGLG